MRLGEAAAGELSHGLKAATLLVALVWALASIGPANADAEEPCVLRIFVELDESEAKRYVSLYVLGHGQNDAGEGNLHFVASAYVPPICELDF